MQTMLMRLSRDRKVRLSDLISRSASTRRHLQLASGPSCLNYRIDADKTARAIQRMTMRFTHDGPLVVEPRRCHSPLPVRRCAQRQCTGTGPAARIFATPGGFHRLGSGAQIVARNRWGGSTADLLPTYSSATTSRLLAQFWSRVRSHGVRVGS